MSAIIIPARYDSKRFPGKVLKEIGGVPMVVRVARQCLLTRADSVCVVTDSEQVAEVVHAANIPVRMSAPDISTGTDRIALAAAEMNEDIIINVQGDEPFIPPALIDELIDSLQEEPELKMNSAYVAFSLQEDYNNPDHVKVVLDKAGYALYFSRYPIPFDRDRATGIVRYRHIGIYGFRRSYLLEYAKMAKTPLESCEMLEQLRALETGTRIKMIKTEYRPVSVDTPEDLKKAEEYLKTLEDNK